MPHRYRQAGRANFAAPGKSASTYSIRADELDSAALVNRCLPREQELAIVSAATLGPLSSCAGAGAFSAARKRRLLMKRGLHARLFTSGSAIVSPAYPASIAIAPRGTCRCRAAPGRSKLSAPSGGRPHGSFGGSHARRATSRLARLASTGRTG